MSALALSYDMQRGNKELAEAIEPYDRLLGYVYVNGNYIEESIEEVKKHLSSPKFVGVKYHPELSFVPPNAPQCEPLWDLIEQEYNKPVLVHTWSMAEHNNDIPSALPEYVAEVARSHPGLKVIMGHMGGPGWRHCLEIAKDIPNVWVDFCSSYADSDKIAYAVNKLGSHRVMFGSGMTENNLWMQIGAILEAQLSEQDRRQVMYGNACRLFGI
jgi:predicted TIM-barrel fold metal-dependent hydrolase